MESNWLAHKLKVFNFLGGLFEEDAGFMRHAFIYATEWINENHVLSQFNLVPEVQDVDPFDNYLVSQRGNYNHTGT